LTDFLKELCNEHGVRLVYTNNKITVLSATTPQGVPNLRVHRLFRECPREVAEAVFEHYVRGETTERVLSKLDRYVAVHSGKTEWCIEPPNPSFRALLGEVGHTRQRQPPPRKQVPPRQERAQPIVGRHGTKEHLPGPDLPPIRPLVVWLIVSAVVTVPLLLGAMGLFLGLEASPLLRGQWVQTALATAVQFVGAWQLHTLFRRERGLSTWVVLSAGLLSCCVYAYSIAVTFGALPGGTLFHVSSVLVVAVLLAEVLVLAARREIYAVATELARQERIRDIEEAVPTGASTEPATRVSQKDSSAGGQLEFPFDLKQSDQLYELEIRAMRQRPFLGGRSEAVDPNLGVRPTADDVMELDIVVDNPRRANNKGGELHGLEASQIPSVPTEAKPRS